MIDIRHSVRHILEHWAPHYYFLPFFAFYLMPISDDPMQKLKANLSHLLYKGELKDPKNKKKKKGEVNFLEEVDKLFNAYEENLQVMTGRRRGYFMLPAYVIC
jgi:hypothetical protein